ncbi:MAG: hypothetical protein IPK82_17760 [Polyangiaceae bacterium]|nr:hypothetical protein [Polyangiaceae bacterium]
MLSKRILLAPAALLSFAAALTGCTEETKGTGGTGATTATSTGGSGGIASTSSGTGGSGGNTTSSTTGGSGGSGGTTTSSTTTTTGVGGSGGGCTDIADRYGGTAFAEETRILAVGVDTNGGFFGAGEFIGATKVGTQSFASAGGSDALLVRHFADGSVAWSQTFGSVYDDRIKALAPLPDGGAVFAGTFDGVVKFGPTTLTSIAGPDAFVARVDALGNVVYALQFINADARALTVEPGGDILVAGDFTGTSQFGAISLTSTQNDLFVTRISPNGAVINATQFALAVKAGALSITGAADHTYLAGSFQNTLTFGADVLVSAGSRDVFLTRLNSNLTPVFARSFGDDTSQEARAAAAFSDNSVALVGSFRGTLNIDGTSLIADTQDDVFVARFDAQGTSLFAKRFGDPAEQIGRAAVVTASDNLLVAGGFQGALNTGNTTLTSAGGDDIFLLQMSLDGTVSKATSFGGISDQRARTVAFDPCNAVVLGGDLTGTLNIGGEIVESQGGLDSFILRVTQ